MISPYSFSTFSWKMLWRILWRSIISPYSFSAFLHIFSIFISALWRKSGNEYGEKIRFFSAFFHKMRSLNTPYYMEKKRKWIWRKFPLFSPLFLHNDFFPFSPLFSTKNGVSILPSIRFSAFRIWRIYGDLRYGLMCLQYIFIAYNTINCISITISNTSLASAIRGVAEVSAKSTPRHRDLFWFDQVDKNGKSSPGVFELQLI